MDALKLISESSMKENVPQFNVGDTVKVHVQIKEGDKSRIQIFEGTVIAKKHGGISETFTVRRVAHGCGIERVFPLHSPVVDKVEVVRYGKVPELSSTTSETELVRLLRLRNSSANRLQTEFSRLCLG
jgi:large subunit ribosomal protein L19